MTADLIKTFVTDYLASLRERTREEKDGMKWGIDWVIYNLGLSLFGKPVRLPFMRRVENFALKSKSEAEFGVDVSFLSEDGSRLSIFVLKDEPLTNKNWFSKGFLEDLSKAMFPNLDGEGLAAVSTVEIILAYNHDEEANGVTLYDLFVAGAPSKIANRADLSFARWNLSQLVDLTLKHLLSPSLVPQRLFGQLNYLCAQVADFHHGSDEWEHQLVPGWRRFVRDCLTEGTDIRGISLVPVALIILRQHGADNPTLETGWIDLMEWAAIALWSQYLDTKSNAVKMVVARFWDSFYLDGIDRFYSQHIDALATEHSVDEVARASLVGVVAAGMTAYWHIARLGILSLGRAQSMPKKSKEEKLEQKKAVAEVADWMVRFINANESTLRPVLDIQHIELLLLAFTLSNARRFAEFGIYLAQLLNRLSMRRHIWIGLPFVDGCNNLENVFEQVATRNADKLITDESSYLVLMLLELSMLLDEPTRGKLILGIHRQLVEGVPEKGAFRGVPAMNLMSWIPPEDWEKKVLQNYVDDGEAVAHGSFLVTADGDAVEIMDGMKRFVRQMREACHRPMKTKLPLAPFILASLRHKSPLPPELWRNAAFPKSD